MRSIFNFNYFQKDVQSRFDQYLITKRQNFMINLRVIYTKPWTLLDLKRLLIACVRNSNIINLQIITQTKNRKMFTYDSQLPPFINYQQLPFNPFLAQQFYFFLPIQPSQQIGDDRAQNLYDNAKVFENYSKDTLIIASPNQSLNHPTKNININKNQISTSPSRFSSNSTINKREMTKPSESGLQKEGRNSHSNLLRMFFRRLQLKLDNQCSILQTIIQKYQLSITSEEFVNWMKSRKIDFRNYIRVPSIKKMFIGDETTKDYSKVLRILFQDFLQKESLICYQTSRKIKKESMPSNYRSIREIYNEILQAPKKKHYC